jgi:mono/diheme cytochrome c family protein
MSWRAMRLPKGLKMSALVGLGIPVLVAFTAISTLAASSPSPSPSGNASAVSGDAARGATLYATNCQTCHGAALEGGIGARLSPIDKLTGVSNPLDPAFLISIITNGRNPQPGDPKQIPMPAKGGNSKLTDQDIKDLAAYIIANQNSTSLPLPPGELAKRTILWVSIAIIAMVFLTFLLAQYNMRWIARRAAARRK